MTRARWRQRAGLPASTAPEPTTLLAQIPWLPIAGALLLVLGALFLIVDLEPSSTAAGGLLIALAALCVSSYRKPASPA